MSTTKVRIGDVLELERIPVDIVPTDMYHQIGIRSYGNGIFHRDPARGDELSKLHYFVLNPDRLVVSNIMAWEGAIALSAAPEDGFIASSRFLSYRRIGNVDLAYLNYFFQSARGVSLVREASTGTVTRNQTVTSKNFENIEIPLPDLDEQRRIAAKLDTLNEKIAHISTARSQMMRTYTSLAESLLNALASNNVRSANVGDLFELNRSEVSIDPHENYRAVGVRSFGKGIIRYSAVSGGELSKLRYFSLPGNAIVLSNIKAWEGAIALTDEHEEHYVASNRFLSYTPVSEDVNLSYVRHYLLSKRGLEQIGKISPGAADRNRTLGRKSFEKMHLPLPEIGQQRKVSNVLDSAAQRLGQRDDGTHLKSLRSSLLNAAFSGRL